MHPGDLVDGRFELEAVAGSGGMGTVFRAKDRANGERVAVKVLRAASVEGPERFARETRVLAALRHPHIVRYIADGRTPSGESWLAMEWLDGEPLHHRLARSPLSPAESVELVRRIAEAVGVAHERGIVHRDLKPSNIMLPGGELARVKVLDFGVARITDARATRTGIMVGTPGYMAPEQAKGERTVGPRSDVFALGCVLYECLTGRPAFRGDNIMALLAKILLDETPRLAELRPELPGSLDELVARTLAKNPERRFASGTELAAALARLGTIEAGGAAPAAELRQSLTETERRLLCVVLVGGVRAPTALTIRDGAITEDPTIQQTPHPTPHSDAFAQTETGESKEPERLAADTLGGLRKAAQSHGASLDRLLDGTYVVTLAGSGDAADQAVRAARCALALKRVSADAPMALAMGRGVMAGQWPVGEAIDRAARLLGAARAHDPTQVRVDDVTAGLLDTRFEVGGDAAGLALVGERDISEVARTVLGKPTPCVGRERELAALYGLFEQCTGEPIARAVIVTGPAGIGKSRVRYELLRRIKEAGPAEIWIGRGDPLLAGSPYGIIAPALRRAVGIRDGEPVEVARQKLRARVMRHAGVELAKTTWFLGELIGAPFPDDVGVELRSARQDPLLMTDQLRCAFEQLVGIEAAAQPVVIVLEDLHWGDLPTVKLVDSALRELADRPVFVIALARPDVYELFPRLWAERGAQEIRLDELTRKGAEKLVRAVLAERATDALVARIVERAAGNAFYLEELIRAAAEGKTDAMPETVLAVVQGRLERLETDARRILRAASVFGQRFWRSGLAVLLGESGGDDVMRAWIGELCERELVSRVPVPRFPDEEELMFRHALVREAAYGMLTDGDRKLGHRLAGEWLERAGEVQPMVLAEHFERGGEPARALEHYQRAAEMALAACDFSAAIERAERAVGCGAKGLVLGELRLIEAESHKWNGDFAAAARLGLEALTMLPKGSAKWFYAAAEAAEGSGKVADLVQLVAIGDAMRDAPDGAGSMAARVSATAQIAWQLFSSGHYELAQVLLDRVDVVSRGVDDPGILARVHQARSSRAMFRGDAGAYLQSEQAAAREFERAGDLRFLCMQRGHVGYACLEIGAFAEAEKYLREALDGGRRMGLVNVMATAKHNLGRALQRQGRLDEALVIESDAATEFRAQGDRRLEGASLFYLGEIYAERGELEAAEREIRRSLELAALPTRPQALAGLAQVLRRRGMLREALAAAKESAELLENLGGVEEGESYIRLTLAECLLDADSDRASAALRAAKQRILERAQKISDPALRKSFLEQIPENARTLALGR